MLHSHIPMAEEGKTRNKRYSRLLVARMHRLVFNRSYPVSKLPLPIWHEYSGPSRLNECVTAILDSQRVEEIRTASESMYLE